MTPSGEDREDDPASGAAPGPEPVPPAPAAPDVADEWLITPAPAHSVPDGAPRDEEPAPSGAGASDSTPLVPGPPPPGSPGWIPAGLSPSVPPWPAVEAAAPDLADAAPVRADEGVIADAPTTEWSRIQPEAEPAPEVEAGAEAGVEPAPEAGVEPEAEPSWYAHAADPIDRPATADLPAPLADEPPPFVTIPDEPEPVSPAETAPEPDAPEPDVVPGLEPVPAPVEAVPDRVENTETMTTTDVSGPLAPRVAVPPTPPVNVSESITSPPDPVLAPDPVRAPDPSFTADPGFTGGTSGPARTEKLASVTADHPEYLVAAALIGGYLLAKVVKKLAG